MARSQTGRQDVGREAKRDFFIQIPAFLEYLPEIDPYAWRLYIHYLRICGTSDQCYEYTSTTARLCRMSERTIRYRRQALADINLIVFWYQGEKGDERVHIIIRDVWEINARFLRMVTNSTIGDWTEEWIRSELLKLPPLGENTLSEGKQPPAPNADPPALGATPPASNAEGPAPNADPPAPGADKERSLRKIPYTDRNTGSEGARVDTPPTPTPPATPKVLRLPNDGYEMQPSVKAKSAPPPVAKPPRPVSPYIDASKWTEDGRIPVGTGATAVEVYYEGFSADENATRLNALDEDDLKRHCPDLERLRKAIEAYRRRKNYQKGNIQLILDWYDDPSKYTKKGVTTNGATSQPAAISDPAAKYSQYAHIGKAKS